MYRRLSATVRLGSIIAVGLLTTSCEDEEKATPQVIFDGTIQRGTGNDCQDVGSLFRIGDFGNLAADPIVPSNAIKDGQAWEQGVVSVGCSVTAAGADEFNVAASVDLSGATGGFFRVDGKFKTSGEQTGIHAIFSKRLSGNTYDQVDRGCTVTYPENGGVAAGRVWGSITCPNAEDADAQKTCTGVAEFRFENCSQ